MDGRIKSLTLTGQSMGGLASLTLYAGHATYPLAIAPKAWIGIVPGCDLGDLYAPETYDSPHTYGDFHVQINSAFGICFFTNSNARKRYW